MGSSIQSRDFFYPNGAPGVGVPRPTAPTRPEDNIRTAIAYMLARYGKVRGK